MRKWRKMTWALAVWSVLMFVWIVAGLGSTHCAQQGGDAGRAGCQVGTGIGVVALLVLWFVVFIVLSLVWLMSRPREAR